MRGYAKGRFSFNVQGGRCESCNGDGVHKIYQIYTYLVKYVKENDIIEKH